MTDIVVERRGVPVLVCGDEGPPIAGTQDALDIIGAAFSRADVVAVPVARLDERFFSLRTGLAGEIMQKFTNYRLRLAVVGDISAQVAASTALRDWCSSPTRATRSGSSPTSTSSTVTWADRPGRTLAQGTGNDRPPGTGHLLPCGTCS